MTGNIPKGPEGCVTVGELIDLTTYMRQTRPKKDGNGDEERKYHIEVEIQCEEVLLAAISHYGPVLWRGRVWWGRMPPREYRVNHTSFGGFGGELPWPPRKPESLPDLTAEQVEVPEKIGGFISQLPH